MLESSGFREILVEADLFSDVVTNQIISGKHYKRGVRAHRLMYEALYRLLLLELGSWLSDQGETDPLGNLDSPSLDEIQQIDQALQRFIDDMQRKSSLFRFWFTYMKNVEVRTPCDRYM